MLAAAASTVGAATIVGFIQLLPKEYSFSRQTDAVDMCSGKLRRVRPVRRMRDETGEIDLLLSLHSLWYANN